jgi:hypothetical protein
VQCRAFCCWALRDHAIAPDCFACRDVYVRLADSIPWASRSDAKACRVPPAPQLNARALASAFWLEVVTALCDHREHEREDRDTAPVRPGFLAWSPIRHLCPDGDSGTDSRFPALTRPSGQ